MLHQAAALWLACVQQWPKLLATAFWVDPSPTICSREEMRHREVN